MKRLDLTLSFSIVLQIDSEDRNWQTAPEDHDGSAREAEVRHLDASAIYKFRVSALFVNNENRWSGNSRRFRLLDDVTSPNHVTTPETHPVIVSVRAVDEDGLEIQWQVRDV